MADAKISALTEHTSPIATDMLAIYDATAGSTKKVSFTNLGAVKKPIYSYNTGGIAVTTNKLMWDIFNASGSGKVIKIFQIESYVRNTAAVVGISIALEVKRTTAVGTGGSTVTADKLDTDNANLPAQITLRSAPTGGATATGNPIAVGNVYTEETINAQPQIPMYANDGNNNRQQITLRVGEGLRLDTGPLGGAGTVAFRIAFTIE